MKTVWHHLLRFVALLLIATVSLQLFFLVRIALMRVVDPQSTTFQRSEARRIIEQQGDLPWRQQWVDLPQMSDHLKRAVIASEDGGFASSGINFVCHIVSLD